MRTFKFRKKEKIKNIVPVKSHKLINCTPHDVYYMDNICQIILTIFKSEKPARVSVENVYLGTYDSIKAYSSKFGKVIDLPKSNGWNLFIVSRLVRDALPKRKDLIVPTELMRDGGGRIIGCRGFEFHPKYRK